MRKTIIAGMVGAVFGLAAWSFYLAAWPGKGWLMGASSDRTRFERIQDYLRGFDQPMWEVGERYRSVHGALGRKNYPLALYHWDKMKVTIENGYLKRPGRKANSDRILLNTAWQQVKDDFASKDPARAWSGFSKARNACMACHVAEEVPFMNQQALFELGPP